MPTPHEMYDVERKRHVKDLPLLKILKSTIDAINVLTGKLQQADAQEDWEAYGHVQELITRLSSNHYSNAAAPSTSEQRLALGIPTSLTSHSGNDFEPQPNNAGGFLPRETINSDEDFEPQPNNAGGFLPPETFNSDDDFEAPLNWSERKNSYHSVEETKST